MLGSYHLGPSDLDHYADSDSGVAHLIELAEPHRRAWTSCTIARNYATSNTYYNHASVYMACHAYVIACGICPLSLYSHEPCGFSTFLYIATVTHVIPRDVPYELRKVTSRTRQGLLAPLAYCCLMRLIRIDDIQRRTNREYKSN